MTEPGFEQNGFFFSLPKLLEGQQTVDKINEGRRDVRRKAHYRALCHIAAGQWIEQNPVSAAYWRRGGIRLA